MTDAVGDPAAEGRRATMYLRDVNVVYRVYEDRQSGLKELISRGRVTRRHREIHAVKGVSLTLYEGETLGIVGGNGSGKSTLMAAMTGLLPLESGSIHVRHRPTLLGVSAALRPGLSGRRNIVIGGLALGLSLDEVHRRMDEIVEFAGLEDFIDLPMRTYSSGMRARLNFAIATATIPDILLIDEALAVGDEEFRRRSQARIDQIRAATGSVVLVSHNLSEIEHTCDRAIWLDRGVLRAEGDPVEVLAAYLGRQPTGASPSDDVERHDDPGPADGVEPADTDAPVPVTGVGASGPRRAVLHIGASLTAVREIQQDLHRRREELGGAGITYPEFLGRNHFELAAHATFEAAGLVGLAGDREGWEAWRADFADRFVAEAGRADRLIASSQHLSSYVRGPAIDELMGLLGRAGFDEVEIVFFAQRQDQMAAKTHATYVRDGRPAPFDLAWHLDARWRYDFDAVIADWERAGVTGVHLRLHPDRPGLPDPVAELCRAAGLPGPPRERGTAPARTLDPQALRFVRDLNALLPREDPHTGELNREFDDLTWVLERASTPGTIGLPLADGRRLMEAYAESNRRLLARLAPEHRVDDYFDPPTVDHELERDYTAADGARYGAELWRQASQVARRLRRVEGR